jgi:hypothetical protein
VGQPPGQDQRAGGVADRDQSQCQHRTDVPAADLEADQGGDAREAEQEAGEPPPVQPVVGPSDHGERGADQRHRGDEQAGERAGQVLLGDPEQQPRRHDLDHREGEQRPPGAGHLGQPAPGQGQREQQQAGQRGAGQHQGARGELVDRHLDQQVGDAPDHAHRHEEHPPSPAHRVPPGVDPTVRSQCAPCP